MQVEDRKGKAQDAQERLVIVEKPVNVSQKLVLANDHEASSSNLKDQDKEKYFQPRWCPPGLTHTQKRRLQRLRRQEQKEKEAEKLRDEIFDECRPRFPQGKMWRVKAVDQPTGPVRPLQPIGQTGVPDRSDRSEQPVRPVDPEPEQKAEEVVPTSAPGASEVPAAPSIAEDEELVDYDASLERTNMEINVVRFSDDYWAIPEEKPAHLDFGPREAIYFRSPRIQIIT